MSDKLLLDIEWTDDCQGKKDYDGPILSISTRYWPRGGGFTLARVEHGRLVDWQENEARPGVPPSAHSSLVLNHRAADEGDWHDWTVLAEQNFEAETQEDVQHQVEQWAQAQMDRVVAILREHFEFKRPD